MQFSQRSDAQELWEEWQNQTRSVYADGEERVAWAERWFEAMEDATRDRETFEDVALQVNTTFFNMYDGFEEVIAVATVVWRFGADLKRAFHPNAKARRAIEVYEQAHPA